ncbi:hypothetical protein [Streptomyces sp. WAC 01529]|uniref:hypothetical protein n=1 Tax=Streptomyces sp. WAC 01529 TaxID=2203205 RepID=UPI0013DF51AA|nr:hypothetical protein [Streptomyces sp. WAC 01529]
MDQPSHHHRRRVMPRRPPEPVWRAVINPCGITELPQDARTALHQRAAARGR